MPNGGRRREVAVEHVLEVGEDRLRGFGAQIRKTAAVIHGPDGSLKHEVEVSGFGQVTGAAVRALRRLQVVGAESAFAVSAIDHRVGEGCFVTGVLQRGGLGKD